MERLQTMVPSARFVKVWNCVGAALMIDPKLAGGKPTMFIAGNDAVARETAAKIVGRVGWDAEDLGQAEAARAIEPLAMLWCIPGFLRNEWTHAFKLIKA